MSLLPTQFVQHRQHRSHHAPSLSGPHGFTATKQASSGDKKHDQLVAQTRKWVSQTFYGEMLKQMRKSPFKTKLSEGGRGGEAFNELFDQHLADKMAVGAGSKLVDAVVDRIELRRGDTPIPEKPALDTTSLTAASGKFVSGKAK